MEHCTCSVKQNRAISSMGATFPQNSSVVFYVGSLPSPIFTLTKPKRYITILVNSKMFQVYTFVITMRVLKVDAEIRAILPIFSCLGFKFVWFFVHILNTPLGKESTDAFFFLAFCKHRVALHVAKN